MQGENDMETASFVSGSRERLAEENEWGNRDDATFVRTTKRPSRGRARTFLENPYPERAAEGNRRKKTVLSTKKKEKTTVGFKMFFVGSTFGQKKRTEGRKYVEYENDGELVNDEIAPLKSKENEKKGKKESQYRCILRSSSLPRSREEEKSDPPFRSPSDGEPSEYLVNGEGNFVLNGEGEKIPNARYIIQVRYGIN